MSESVRDRMAVYLAGREARRTGEPLAGSPHAAGQDAELWELGWLDEEAYAVQREALLAVNEEAAAYRRGIRDVLSVVVDPMELRAPDAALRVLYAPLVDRLRVARDEGARARRHG